MDNYITELKSIIDSGMTNDKLEQFITNIQNISYNQALVDVNEQSKSIVCMTEHVNKRFGFNDKLPYGIFSIHDRKTIFKLQKPYLSETITENENLQDEDKLKRLSIHKFACSKVNPMVSKSYGFKCKSCDNKVGFNLMTIK